MRTHMPTLTLVAMCVVSLHTSVRVCSCSVLEVRPATESELLTIHTQEHVSGVLAGQAMPDASTYFHKKDSKSSDAARLTAGGTLKVVRMHACLRSMSTACYMLDQ